MPAASGGKNKPEGLEKQTAEKVLLLKMPVMTYITFKDLDKIFHYSLAPSTRCKARKEKIKLLAVNFKAYNR